MGGGPAALINHFLSWPTRRVLPELGAASPRLERALHAGELVGDGEVMDFHPAMTRRNTE